MADNGPARWHIAERCYRCKAHFSTNGCLVSCYTCGISFHVSMAEKKSMDLTPCDATPSEEETRTSTTTY